MHPIAITVTAGLLWIGVVTAPATPEEVAELQSQATACFKLSYFQVAVDAGRFSTDQHKDNVENCILGRMAIRDGALTYAKFNEIAAAHVKKATEASTTEKSKWTKVEALVGMDANLRKMIGKTINIALASANPVTGTNAQGLTIASVAALTPVHTSVTKILNGGEATNKKANAAEANPNDELLAATYKDHWGPPPTATTKDNSQQNILQANHNLLSLQLAAFAHVDCTGKDGPFPDLTKGYNPAFKHVREISSVQAAWCVMGDDGKLQGGKDQAEGSAAEEAEEYLECMVGRSIRRLAAHEETKNLAKFLFLRTSWFLQDLYMYVCGPLDLPAYTFTTATPSKRELLGIKKLHQFIDGRIGRKNTTP